MMITAEMNDSNNVDNSNDANNDNDNNNSTVYLPNSSYKMFHLEEYRM